MKYISKAKIKMGPYHFVLTTTKTFTKIPKLTKVENQQLPDFEKPGFKEELSYLNRRKDKGRRKVCAFFKTDTDKTKTLAYRH